MGKRKTKLSTKYMWLRYGMRGALEYLESLIDEPERAVEWADEVRRYIESQRTEHRFQVKP